MNQIERLRDDLTKRFPGREIELRGPTEGPGSRFLDIDRGDLDPVVVEWRPDRGFGVSTPEASDYGTGVDEVYPNVRAAYDRVIHLVLMGTSTEPPLAVRLAELRQMRGVSQAELAALVGVGQANISHIESRNDVLLSTLVKIVRALGAELSIRASGPTGRSGS